jgi:NTE family protein
MVYLGQDDNRLPVKPPDLVARSAVRNYPTDFSPMSDKNIELLTTRGEQLTRLLLDHYAAQL